MKVGSRVKATENSGLIGREGLPRMGCRAETIPSNLAEICLKHRKTKAFRSSRATDKAFRAVRSITSDKGYLSVVSHRGLIYMMYGTVINL